MNLRRQSIDGYLLMIPALLVVGFVLVYPIGYLIYVSFTDTSVYNLGQANFTGLQNYLRIFRDPSFISSTKVTVAFAGADITLQFLLGFSMALMVHSKLRGGLRDVVIALFLLPAIMAPVVVGLFFRIMLNTEFGIVNYFLGNFGTETIPWLADSTFAFWAVVMASVWTGGPMMFIILLGGLLNLPKQPYEAAEIDGASRVQTLFYLTAPMLRPVIFSALILRTMDILKVFDKIFVLTGGGPGTATEVLTVRMYKAVFSTMEIGYGSAIGVCVLILVVIVSGFLIHFSSEK